jgi:hypothetical protein
MKVQNLKVGDVITKNFDVGSRGTGKVTRIRQPLGNSLMRDIYLDEARFPIRVHCLAKVEIKARDELAN